MKGSGSESAFVEMHDRLAEKMALRKGLNATQFLDSSITLSALKCRDVGHPLKIESPASTLEASSNDATLTFAS